jgi:hypothetical protein
VITPAYVENFEGDLYTLTNRPITEFGYLDLMGCPNIFYILEGPVFSDAAVAAQFIFDERNGMI